MLFYCLSGFFCALRTLGSWREVESGGGEWGGVFCIGGGGTCYSVCAVGIVTMTTILGTVSV